MNTLLWVVVVLAYAALLAWLGWKNRFRKPPSPDIVTTTCKPGATTLRMVDDRGVVRATVVLSNITWGGFDGTQVEFVDLSRYMTNRRVWGKG